MAWKFGLQLDQTTPAGSPIAADQLDVAVILVEPVQLSRTFTSNLADLTINSRAQLICIV
jgi:hypothetical protein